ncbi:MAG TPA: MBL fold metallo-hydrolase [Candidatus Sulfotelmatobacter sp.]|nr:MBL fold metallo-hydrolase [Candidatus Sulfotelmatobacter sp.]
MATRAHKTEPRLIFLGAAGTVTGSCYVVETANAKTGGTRVLVDCGLFQGSKSLKALNYGAFPVDPRTIHALLLTHAHIDHSGLVPALVKAGFRGPVLATRPTRDLLSCMLPDCGHIQEYEVEQLNRRRRQRDEAPVAPIYTQADGEACLAHVRPVAYDSWLDVAPGMRARFWDAGHILGSASIELELARPSDAGADAPPLRLLFSGDLGGADKPLHEHARAPSDVDVLVVESTYGDRVRATVTADERRALLGRELAEALALGGNVVIPVFAVERTQELLYDLGLLRAAGSLPHCEIFLDSPLAIRSTEVFERNLRALGAAAHEDHPFRRAHPHFVDTVEASKHLNRIRSGAVILAASGMCEAGRVRHHLKHNLWRADSTVLMVGYQAAGTLGRLLLDGATEVQMMGERVHVKARIRMLDVYSAHADQAALTRWVVERQPIRRAVVLSHGEPQALAAFEAVLAPRLGATPILVPALGDALALDGAAAPALVPAVPRLAEAAAAHADWHNDYAALRLALDQTIRGAPDDPARQATLDRVRAALARR